MKFILKILLSILVICLIFLFFGFLYNNAWIILMALVSALVWSVYKGIVQPFIESLFEK